MLHIGYIATRRWRPKWSGKISYLSLAFLCLLSEIPSNWISISGRWSEFPQPPSVGFMFYFIFVSVFSVKRDWRSWSGFDISPNFLLRKMEVPTTPSSLAFDSGIVNWFAFFYGDGRPALFPCQFSSSDLGWSSVVCVSCWMRSQRCCRLKLSRRWILGRWRCRPEVVFSYVLVRFSGDFRRCLCRNSVGLLVGEDGGVCIGMTVVFSPNTCLFRFVVWRVIMSPTVFCGLRIVVGWCWV